MIRTTTSLGLLAALLCTAAAPAPRAPTATPAQADAFVADAEKQLAAA